MSNSKRTVTTFPDGTINVKVVDTRTEAEKLTVLSFKDRMEIMFPTSKIDITDGWVDFDDHKRLK